MGWSQVKGYDINKAGKDLGYCYRNVRTGYGIGSSWFYGVAHDSWDKNQVQHKDRNIPTGIVVPLYYDFYLQGKNPGHINVRLADGRVYSDGTYYPNLAEYERTHHNNPYLGWGERVGGQAVIQYTADQSGFQLPPIGSTIHLDPGQDRTTFNTSGGVAGVIHVNANDFNYVVRGHANNRVIINSASAGGNNVQLALYYVSGTRIDGWRQV